MIRSESGNQSGVQLWNLCTAFSSPEARLIRAIDQAMPRFATPQNHFPSADQNNCW